MAKAIKYHRLLPDRPVPGRGRCLLQHIRHDVPYDAKCACLETRTRYTLHSTKALHFAQARHNLATKSQWHASALQQNEAKFSSVRDIAPHRRPNIRTRPFRGTEAFPHPSQYATPCQVTQNSHASQYARWLLNTCHTPTLAACQGTASYSPHTSHTLTLHAGTKWFESETSPLP